MNELSNFWIQIVFGLISRPQVSDIGVCPVGIFIFKILTFIRITHTLNGSLSEYFVKCLNILFKNKLIIFFTMFAFNIWCTCFIFVPLMSSGLCLF